ncbi:MAG: hypothetical protein AAF222_01485 [Pseudomonadota bacterium]
MLTSSNVLVAGVSSAGKSTFIANHLMPEMTSAGRRHHVYFAGQLMRQYNLRGELVGPAPPFSLARSGVSIVHLNLLMPREDDLATFSQALMAWATDYDVYLCYAPDAVIRARIANRTKVEPRLSGDASPYPAEQFQERFSDVDQRQMLLTFGEAIAPAARSRTIVFSNDRTTSHLTWDDFLYARPSPALEAALTQRPD